MKSRAFMVLGVAASLLVLLLVAVLTVRYAQALAHQQAFRHLETMLLLRESKLTSYLESLQSEIALWSGHENISVFMQELQESARVRNPGDQAGGISSTRYFDSGGDIEPATRELLIEFARYHQYADVYFISLTGDVLFTVKKLADLNTNLLAGPHRSTGLAQVFREAMAYEDADSLAFAGFSNYPPNQNLPAAFLASRIHTPARGNMGVLAIQVPPQPVDEIMQFASGMGNTGEIYLVGTDKLMRSSSRFIEESTVLKQEVNTVPAVAALGGENGSVIAQDYRGVQVLSVYKPIKFEGIVWAMLAEQDLAEVDQGLKRVRLFLLLAIAVPALLLLLVLWHSLRNSTRSAD